MDFAAPEKLPYPVGKSHERRPNIAWATLDDPCWLFARAHKPLENTKIYTFLCIRKYFCLRSGAADAAPKGTGAPEMFTDKILPLSKSSGL